MPEKRDWRQRPARRRNVKPDPAAPPEAPRPARRGWRREPPGSSSTGSAAQGGLGSWLTPRSRQAETSQVYFYGQLLLLGLVTLGLVLGFYHLLVRSRDVPLIAVAITRYKAPIDPNAFAREDIRRLPSANPNNILTRACDDTTDLTRDALEVFLKQQLKKPPGGPNNDVVLIYLSAHGVLDDDGNPCLLTTDADPLDSSGWYPLKDLLQLITEQVRRHNGAENVKKLLVLDSGRMANNWPTGILENGFPERLAHAVHQSGDPNLYLLNSNRSGEFSWSAPELGGSAFGYFFAQALIGEEDKDGQITLLELFDRIRQNTDAWARTRRASRQRPVLIPALDTQNDFPLVYAGGSSIDPPTLELLEAYRQELTQQWSRIHDLWTQAQDLDRRKAPVRFQPLAWADLRQHLLRAEQLMLAGQAYAKDRDDTIRDAQSLLSQIGRGGRGGSPLTLTLHAHGRAAPNGESTDKWNLAKRAWDATIRPSAGDGEQSGATPIGYTPAAAATYNWLATRDVVNPGDLTAAIKFLDQHDQGRPTPDLVVAHFLRMLNHDLDTSGPNQLLRSQDVALAIRARQLAERVADPGDERIQYGLRQAVDHLDRRRRLAEDQLLVGDLASLQEARSGFLILTAKDLAQPGYPAAVERAGRLTRQYALRDEIYADVPYLARWLVGQVVPHKSVGHEEAIQRAANDLVPLIRAVHRLAASLDQGQADQPGQDKTDIQAVWSRLKSTYSEYARTLEEETTSDEQKLRETVDVLAVPTLAVSRRDALMQTFIRRLCAPWREHSPIPTSSGPGDNSGRQDTPDTTGPSGRHVALEILDRSQLRLASDTTAKPDPGAELALRLASQGAEVRRLLADLPVVSRRLQRATRSGPAAAARTALPVDIRLGLSEADRLTRSAAALRPVLSMSNDQPGEPAQRLRRLDLSFQLLWHSQRFLVDFWGRAADGGRTGEDFYVSAIQAYLQSARSLRRDICDNVAPIERIAQEMQARQRASEAMAQNITTEDEICLDDVRDVPHQVRLRWQSGLPDGLAAVYVAPANKPAGLVPLHDPNSEATIRRRAWAHDQSLLSWNHLIPRNEITADGLLAAVVYYRGHHWRRNFQIQVPTQVRTYVTTNPRRSAAEIEVRGQSERTGHVMFVLDCSGSLKKGGKDLMRPAKLALRKVLAALEASKEPYEVGLRVYGNRTRFVANDGIKRRLDQFPEVHPDLDVQLVQPMQKLNRNLLGTLNRLLQVRAGAAPVPLDAWGQTPLYLTLSMCFRDQDFSRARGFEPKRIVVITDGVNGQFRRQTTTAEDVLVARRQAGLGDVPVDVIGLSLAMNPQVLQRQLKALRGAAPPANSELELAWLADQTGGMYFSADEETLGSSLRAALGMVRYSVRSDRGPPEDADLEYELGQPWRVRGLPVEPVDCDVQLHGVDSAPSERLKLEGGEKVVLEYDRLQNQLRYPEFRPLDARGQVLYVPGKTPATRYRIQALMPRSVPGRPASWDFLVYVQRQSVATEQYRFTARPRHVWAEIQPRVRRRDEGPPFVFFDCDFLEDQPVPVFRFRARDWPGQADTARVNLWFAVDPHAVTPNDSREVALVDRFQVKGMSEVSLEVNAKTLAGARYQVVVTERHSLSAPGEPLRVQLYPVADRIERRDFIGVNASRHTFDYATQRPAQLQITSRSRILADAIHVPELEVVLPAR